MERVGFAEYQGLRILVVDYAGLRTPADLAPLAEEASRLIRAEPPGSVLVLVDLTEVPHSLRSARQLGEMAVANAEFVRARAVVGLSEPALPLLRTITDLSAKPMAAFADRAAALDWLAERAV